MATLRPLAARFPEAAQTQYELGAALHELGQCEEALRHLRRASALNPDLAEPWRLQGDVLFEMGEVRSAEHAYGRSALSGLSAELKPAAHALEQGDLAAAQAHLLRRLQAGSRDVDALGLLGEVLLRDGRPGPAEEVLRAQAEIDPQRSRFRLATALFQQQKAQECLALVQTTLTETPEDPAALNLKGACLALLGDFEGAAHLFETILGRYPKHARLWANYGRILRSLGRPDEAAEALRRSLELDPSIGEAYWSLANLKSHAFSIQDLAAIRSALADPRQSGDDLVQLSYALGKALEDRGEDQAAFASYAEGARRRRAVLRYDPLEISHFVDEAIETLTEGFFAAREGWGETAAGPIFIVGLPRSGSTLVEQILASHPEIEGTLELPHIRIMADRIERGARSRSYLEGLAGLDAAAASELGRGYLAAASPNRRLRRLFFIDKTPSNFLHLGLVRLALPHAKIIDARRNPMAAGFSAFRHHFGASQSFSYSLPDIAAYYKDYLRLMRHFDGTLPGLVHRIIYEDLVADIEREVRSLLEFLGLNFDSACLDFHRTQRAVSTVSSEQVRRPLFREGLDQWRRFEPWLGPLADELGEAVIDWRR